MVKPLVYMSNDEKHQSRILKTNDFVRSNCINNDSTRRRGAQQRMCRFRSYAGLHQIDVISSRQQALFGTNSRGTIYLDTCLERTIATLIHSFAI